MRVGLGHSSLVCKPLSAKQRQQVILAACLLLLFALPSVQLAEAQGVLRDSLGIRIVENVSPASVRVTFSVDTVPRVTIGRSSSDPNYQLDRVSGATLLPNKQIAVGLARDAQVRVFDSAGRFVRAIGRKGNGPGEFSQITGVGRFSGDTLLLTDGSRLRVAMVSSVGEFIAEFRTAPTPRGCCLRNGSFIGLVPDRSSSGAMSPTRRRFAVVGFRLVAGIPAADTLAHVLGNDPILSVPVQSAMRVDNARGATSVFTLSAPFGRTTSVAVFGQGFVVGDGTKYEISVFSVGGALTQLIRASAEEVPITPAMRRRFEADVTRKLTGAVRDGHSAALTAYSYPSRAPAFRNIKVDDTGRLWIEQYPMPGEQQTTWAVFSPAGLLLGRAITPAKYDVQWIGSDRVIATEMGGDGLEVLHVLRYTYSPAR